VNKEKVEKLLSANLLATAGLAAIELANQSATWMALDEVTAILIPDDLQRLLDKNKIAATNFNAFPRSAKRGILECYKMLNAPKPD